MNSTSRSRIDRDGALIPDRLEPRQRHDRLLLGEERPGRPVARVAAAVGALGLLLLQAPGVGEHQRAQVLRAGCAENATVEALGHQPRQHPDVVQVGVGEHHRVDGRRRHRRVGPVAEPQLLQALEHAAVDKHPPAVRVDQVARPGDRAGGPQERERRRHGRPGLYQMRFAPSARRGLLSYEVRHVRAAPFPRRGAPDASRIPRSCSALAVTSAPRSRRRARSPSTTSTTRRSGSTSAAARRPA